LARLPPLDGQHSGNIRSPAGETPAAASLPPAPGPGESRPPPLGDRRPRLEPRPGQPPLSPPGAADQDRPEPGREQSGDRFPGPPGSAPGSREQPGG